LLSVLAEDWLWLRVEVSFDGGFQEQAMFSEGVA
jgi:hypothetical protein